MEDRLREIVNLQLSLKWGFADVKECMNMSSLSVLIV